MNTLNSSGASEWPQLKFLVGAFMLLAGLTFTFFNAFGNGFTSGKAHLLFGWFCASVATTYLVLSANKEKTNWVALLFFALFLFIVIRQGPKPIHAAGLGLIVLTMACVAHTATLFARFRSWAYVLATAVVLIAVLNALVALYQYFGFSIQYPIPYVAMSPQGYAMGQVRQRNQLAILCVLGLVALAYFPTKFRLAGVVRFGLGLCLVAAVAASASRIGAVAITLFSCTLIFTFRSLPSSSKWLVGFAFPAFLLLVYLLPLAVGDKEGLLSRLTENSLADGCYSRFLVWKNVLSLIWQAPWIGVGWGGLIGEYYLSDLPARGCEMIDHAHNIYLQIAVEAGLPAAVLLLFVSMWFFVKHWILVGANDIYRWAYFSVSMIWLYAQTEFPLWETGFLWLFAIFLGLIAVRESALMPGIGQKIRQRLYAQVNPRLIVLITLTTACLSAMALIQFFRVSSIETSTEWERQLAKRSYQELIKENWMFALRLEFIAAQMHRPTAANAEKINKFCTSVMTYSPDAPIIMCVIRSAYLMGDMKQVEFHKQRLLTIYARRADKYRQELDNFK